MSRWISSLVLALSLTLSFTAWTPAQNILPAVIVVRVPPDAEVLIGSQKMTQTGAERRFVTGPLENGVYIYDVTVSWSEGSKKFKKTRQVHFSPGKTAVIEFNSPAAFAFAGEVTATPTSFVADPPVVEAVKSRQFSFTYAGKVTGLPPGAAAKIWLPKPQTTPEQDVAVEAIRVPGAVRETKEKTYGNAILFTEAASDAQGEISFAVDYRITRREVKTGGEIDLARSATESGELLTRYLQRDARVPIDGKPLELLRDRKLPMETLAAAKTLYDIVNAHMRYSKEGTGWGQGDAAWACDSKYGNCSDFHSLFISLARGSKIPAKFEIGFSIPTIHGAGPVTGYHCWGWFLAKNKWLPVDISEASRHPKLNDYYFGNLTEDRVQFTTGRDLDLEPRQAGGALNFFIDPYVEVDGRPFDAAKVQKVCSYKDIP